MKIYTRTGDKGMTSIIGGTRLPKYHPRIEAYGNIDELISWLGLLRGSDELKNRTEELISIQATLMHCCAIVATDPASKPAFEMKDEVIKMLEDSIDLMETELPELDSFILPGGSQTVSYCHITRCVCRRAERSVLRLDEEESAPSDVIKYLNRLADYLFVLGRAIAYETGTEEVKWLPGKNM
jgi:cob(I)alamin adenosyltransferase